MTRATCRGRQDGGDETHEKRHLITFQIERVLNSIPLNQKQIQPSVLLPNLIS